MAEFPDNYQDDFEVYPSPLAASGEFTQALTSLRQALRPVDTKQHRRDGESYEDLIIRLALNGTNSTAVLFRKNDTAEEVKVQAWLSIINEKSKLTLIKKPTKRFEGLTEEDLREVARISLRPDSTRSVVDFLAESFGILLIVESSFKSMKVDGCTFKLPQGTPVIGISVRYNRYDNFWFTLMHELAHVHLHYAELDKPILDDLDEGDTSENEVDANIVAKDSLVPRRFWRLIWGARENKRQFHELCRQAEVHPAIAAGMIRFQAKNYALYAEYQNIMNVRQAFGIADD